VTACAVNAGTAEITATTPEVTETATVKT